MRVFRRGNIYWVDYTGPDGRRARHSANTTSKTEAEAILASLVTKVREGKFFDTRTETRTRFKDLLERARRYEEKIGRRSLDGFYKHYFNILERFFGEKYLEEINPALVEEFQFARAGEVSKSTANRSLAALRKVFNLGIRWGLVKANPVKQVEFFKEPRGRIRFLEKPEQEALLGQCQGRLKDVVLVALRTGMRRGELLGLRKKDVDFQKGFIYLERTKSGQHRQIPIIPEVRAVLSRLAFGLTDEEPLFRNRLGKPYRDLRTPFQNAMARAGIRDFRFHDLRHTYASDLVMAGVDIFTVSKLLGHSSVQTTMIYAHLSPDHHQAEMERYQRYLHGTAGTKLAQSAV